MEDEYIDPAWRLRGDDLATIKGNMFRALTANEYAYVKRNPEVLSGYATTVICIPRAGGTWRYIGDRYEFNPSHALGIMRGAAIAVPRVNFIEKFGHSPIAVAIEAAQG